jgi:molybdate transport system ATP-binding protein
MLERFHLINAVEALPNKVSPEQRLRCEVARALMAEPKLLLIDECGIDESLLRQAEVPVLLATGDLDLCYSAAGQLVLLESGRIVQSGPARSVIDKPDSIEAARLLRIPNLYQATIGALDPGRNSSRLEFEGFALTAGYLPGHFRGDRVWVAIRSEDLRVHSSEAESQPNFVSARLVRVSERPRFVRLEFSGTIFADVPREDFEQQKDNKGWQVEFPPECLKIL